MASAAATVTSNLDLFDFIESLEKEEEKYSTTTADAATTAALNNTNIDDTAISASASSSSIISNQDLDETVDVWQDIADVLNNWSE